MERISDPKRPKQSPSPDAEELGVLVIIMLIMMIIIKGITAGQVSTFYFGSSGSASVKGQKWVLAQHMYADRRPR